MHIDNLTFLTVHGKKHIVFIETLVVLMNRLYSYSYSIFVLPLTVIQHCIALLYITNMSIGGSVSSNDQCYTSSNEWQFDLKPKLNNLMNMDLQYK